MKQYCTSEEDIETLFTYFQAAINGEENKESLKRLLDLQCGVMRSRPYRSERYRPVCYPDCENEKRIRKDAQETVIDRVILEMVYSEKGFPKTVKEFSERITQLRQQAGE